MESEHRNDVSRRNFLKTTVVAGGLAAAAGRVTAQTATPTPLQKDCVILFQGDSITDAGRDRRGGAANNWRGLGRGYALLAGAGLLASYGGHNLQVYNRGISGNKVPDLAARWQRDAIDLKPAVLSILIGVNDIWHKLNGRYDGTVEDYETGYRALLKQTREALPNTRIVICEPFVLRCGAINEKWFPEFDQRRGVAKQMADEFNLTFVPFQAMFDTATKQAPPNHWAGDGVHPTLAGHALMARTWREVTGY